MNFRETFFFRENFLCRDKWSLWCLYGHMISRSTIFFAKIFFLRCMAFCYERMQNFAYFYVGMRLFGENVFFRESISLTRQMVLMVSLWSTQFRDEVINISRSILFSRKL